MKGTKRIVIGVFGTVCSGLGLALQWEALSFGVPNGWVGVIFSAQFLVLSLAFFVAMIVAGVLARRSTASGPAPR